MSAKSDKQFDSLMQDKFRDFKAEPPAGLWPQISAELDKPAKKRLPLAWLSAAAVLLFAAIGLWRYQPAPLAGEPAVHAAVVQQNDSPSIAEADRRELAQKAAGPKVVLAPGPLPEKVKVPAIPQPRVFAAAKPEAVPLPEQAAVTHLVPTAGAEPAPGLLDAAPEPMLATLPAEAYPEATEENAPERRQRSGSIGRFVNKLVSKVDSREDKLIEVSEEAGEGLKITGLNFGLVKMKNKYNK